MDDDEKLSLYSFGALIKYSDIGSVVEFEERETYIVAYCGVMAFSILVTFIMINVIRKKLNHDVEVVDKLSYTPSDFCVVGNCPEFSEGCDYTIKGIEEEVRQVFKEKYEIEDIQYVNVAYDIEDIFELLDQERKLLKKRELIKWYLDKKGWTEEYYTAECENIDEYEDFPSERLGLSSCFKRQPLMIETVE